MGSLSQLAKTLPNGFHDAELQSVLIDYSKGEVLLKLNIWIGDLNDDMQREAYRLAEVKLSGFVFWIVEPPNTNDPYDIAGDVRIDIGLVSELKSEPSIHLPNVPADAFLNWIYVYEWNSCVYVAAREASMEWMGPRVIRS